ncbi:sialidase family protein [Solirubrobacter soli]|uniref:sialidase family protein n=1 Tax=Solirubrobacter soli TaxID=363832 RepID=UPI0005651059|nr:sialidase family protein [Solirubrobacter soli]
MTITAVAAVAAALLAAASPASANVPLTRVSADPFTNATSQHATEVEPDTFAFGQTVVAAYQVGRFFDGGATDVGFSRSLNGGATWGAPGFLPGMTFSSGAAVPYERVSDASVAYDAKHATWLISSIPLLPNTAVPTIFVNRSTDNGATFGPPVSIPPTSKKVDLDKNWTVCDNHAASPFYGNCYTEFDSFGEGDLEYMSTSRDGGATWSVPVSPQGKPKGLGGQPVVRPDGTVVVPFESLKGTISAFRSTDGGASWTKETIISKINFHPVAGDLRTSPLPSAEIDAAGRTYVAWEDCRFQPRCTANDIVLSSSADGLDWRAVSRIPIDDVGSGADHFIPGLAVDPATTGRLALTYYSYRNAACTEATCQMDVGFTSSPDGGAHWGAPTTLAGPMSLTDIADTSQGPMVGDYISTSFNGVGTAATVFAIGKPHTGTVFDEGMWAPSTPLPVTTAATRAATTEGAANGQGVGAAQAAVRGD